MTRQREEQEQPLAQFNPWLATASPLIDNSVKITDTLYTCAFEVASELTDFALLRLLEDVRLPERLARCRSPQDVQQTWMEFWNRAFDQYGTEWSRLAEINREVLSAPIVTRGRHSEHKVHAAA